MKHIVRRDAVLFNMTGWWIDDWLYLHDGMMLMLHFETNGDGC